MREEKGREGEGGGGGEGLERGGGIVLLLDLKQHAVGLTAYPISKWVTNCRWLCGFGGMQGWCRDGVFRWVFSVGEPWNRMCRFASVCAGETLIGS